VEYAFVESAEGLIDIVLDSDAPILAHAMADSLGTRPPRGASQDGPSTYWIDHALTQLRARLEDLDESPFASGNVTYLALKDGAVEVRYDYDPPYSEYVDTVEPGELIELLEAWRRAVIELDPQAVRRLPPPPKALPMPPA
jgi:hypothetical protein